MKNGNWVFWTFGIGSVIFMGVTLYFNYKYAVKLGIERQGLFGDMFGASNALFTGLSFVGVIIAILLQRQELKLQRNELELTRNEMEQTRDEFVTQNFTMKLQQFENTFFQMLNLFHNRLNDMSAFNYSNEIIGKDVFNYINTQHLNKLREELKTILGIDHTRLDNYENEINDEYAKLDINTWINIYNTTNKRFKNILTPYFLSLYSLLRLIDNSEVLEKNLYSEIIKSHLTNEEINIIFYECMSGFANKEFIKLIIKYNLIEHLNEDYLHNNNFKRIFQDLTNKTVP